MLTNSYQHARGRKTGFQTVSLFAILVFALTLGACAGVPVQSGLAPMKAANRIAADQALGRPDAHSQGATYWTLHAW